MLNHCLQFAFHDWSPVRTSHEEILEIRGGENQHLTRSVHAVKLVALARLGQFRPVLEVAKLLLRLLRKQVVCEANRQLTIAMQFVHDAIVVGIVLEATAGIDHAGKAKAVEFPEKE